MITSGTLILNKRVKYGKQDKNTFKASTIDSLQEKLDILTEETLSIKRQLDFADSESIKNCIPINTIWYNKAEQSLLLKTKQLGYIQKQLKSRRKEEKKVELELSKAREEINAFRNAMEERVFAQVCSERLDKELYLSIWEEVKSRMPNFTQTVKAS